MSDKPVVHIGENSPEEVAYKLLRTIAAAENKGLMPWSANSSPFADRKWLLDAYAECLLAVRNPGGRLS